MSKIANSVGLSFKYLRVSSYFNDLCSFYRVLSRGAPDKVFDRNEIEDAIAIGEKSGLKLMEPIDYACMDKVVHWDQTGLDYTFIFFAMKK
jgi:hypothetical protein